jgi:hypothetical protein
MHLSKISFPAQFLTPMHRIRRALSGGGSQDFGACRYAADEGFVADGDGALTRLR